MTRAGPEAFAFQCTVTIALRGRGQITTQGLFAYRRGEPGGEPTIAITGGTGDYAGASGTVTIVERRDTPTRLRIRLR